MIKLLVIGNLGRDAVVNNVNTRTVINFSVAHTEKFKDSSGAQRERTVWVDCAYWTDRTAIAPYLKKGTQVFVEGSPEVRTYETQDGKQGASLSVRVQNIQLLGNRNSSGDSSQGNDGESSQTSAGSDQNAEDDLPF